jgi:hypothetical protein
MAHAAQLVAGEVHTEVVTDEREKLHQLFMRKLRVFAVV